MNHEFLGDKRQFYPISSNHSGFSNPYLNRIMLHLLFQEFYLSRVNALLFFMQALFITFINKKDGLQIT